VCLIAGMLAASASAHIVYDRRTLPQWIARARLILVAEVRTPLLIWSAPDGSDHQEYFSVRVIEVLAGASPAQELDVFAHAEGEPRLRVGQNMLLFLDPTAEHAEFAHLASRFPYFTTQGAGQEWSFASGDATLPALARAWREVLRRGGSYQDRRTLVIRQLEMTDPRLRADALRQLLRLRGTQDFAADGAAQKRLAEMTATPDLSISQRIGLIKILDGIGGFSASSALMRLATSDLTAAERLAVIRACRGVDDAAIGVWLGDQLRSTDVDVTIAALTAVASPYHSALVEPIAVLAGDARQRVARSAVRSLAAIGSARARAHLVRIAAGRGDAAKLAAAALRRRTPEK